MRGRAVLAAAPIAWLLLAVIPVAAEDVNLSKYKLQVSTVTMNPNFAVVGQTELETRCRDKDGCTATLIIQRDDYVVGATAVRLFMAPGDHSWISQGATTVGPTADGESPGTQAAHANSFDSTSVCAFSDADATGDDVAVGFVVAVFKTGPGEASCTLALED